MSIVHAAVGGVTESDVQLAAASDAIVVAFNVRPIGKASQVAENEAVEIRSYRIVYALVDDVKKAMAGLLEPERVEKSLGRAEVRRVFRLGKVQVAGCSVLEGTIRRSARARLVRDGRVERDARIESLRRFKDDVEHVDQGFECGLMLEGHPEVRIGDAVECYEVQYIPAAP